MNKISFVDLRTQYLNIKTEIDQAIEAVISDTAFIRGKYVSQFEKEFAKAYGVKHCIGVGNGTDSLYIIMKMLGIGTGDEVVTVSNSWISTSETISQTGARPVFVEPDEYFTINVDQIESHITTNTRAILPVHIYGQACDMRALIKICKKYNFYLIEDCAQAHFAKFNETNVGLFGDAASFSFFPGKNLGAYGDAGAIITNDDHLAEKFRMYANHGAIVKHHHLMEGINSRLDGLQAAILSVKLRHLEKWTTQRIQNAKRYSLLLEDIPQIELPKVRPNTKHCYHLYVIKAHERNKLQDFLNKNDIPTAIHYPVPLPLMPAYKYLQLQPADYPLSIINMKSILSLPMYPELSQDQMQYISLKIREFYSKT